MESKSLPPNRLVRTHREVNAAGRMHPAVMMGSSFAVAMGLFAWLGHRWDEKTGWEPLGVLLGVSVGFLYGGYEVWKLTRPSAAATSASATSAAATSAVDSYAVDSSVNCAAASEPEASPKTATEKPQVKEESL